MRAAPQHSDKMHRSALFSTTDTLVLEHNPLCHSAHVYILSEKGAVHPVRFLFDRHRKFA